MDYPVFKYGIIKFMLGRCLIWISVKVLKIIDENNSNKVINF